MLGGSCVIVKATEVWDYFTEAELKDLTFTKVGEGLIYIHSMSLVHMDTLKPGSSITDLSWPMYS